MGEFISLWQIATLWSLAESKCYCRVITKGRGKQCPEEINSTEQIMEQYKAGVQAVEQNSFSEQKPPVTCF